MTRNATAQQVLTLTQLAAIGALTEGRSITDAAEFAHVDRTTIHRWLRDDYAFIAAFNGAKRQLREETKTRLSAAAVRAAETVEKAVCDGNVSAALAVLRGLGLLKGTFHIGSDDARELEENAEAERLNAEFLRSLRC